jgi:hypothetical protein
MKAYRIFIIASILLLNAVFSQSTVYSQTGGIVKDKANKTITITGSNGELKIRLNYSKGCVLDKIMVKGTEVTGGGNPVYSGFRSGDSLYSSTQCLHLPIITIKADSVNIDNIQFGSPVFSVAEKWIFKINGNDISWQITRRYLNDGLIDENFFPCWQFQSMQTWDGALLDNGGVAWNRFLGQPGDAYGVNAGTITLWNRSKNSCLRILSENDNTTFKTATFSHLKNGVHSVAQSSSAQAVATKFGLRRYITTGESVFAPFPVSRSAITNQFIMKALTYDQEYDRGELKGIREESVNEILNTIGRYGVVDKNLFGSNGWRTGWVVLQEPWLALFGNAINSADYINGFSQALEFAREHAVMPDGRVLPRWHHDSTDAMPGTFRPDGFYECQWGYMLDCQPAFAINVAEQFDLTGDLAWLRGFKKTCEKVLDYMIKRDPDGNGLFEVVQKTHRENKGTDWLDVVWASYEVSTINAFMYRALIRWSELEALLGDPMMSEKYLGLAVKLKTTFNKSTAEGGFWDPEHQCYVHWREPDGSVYGSNLVSVVNFLAIGYGICDDPSRVKSILDTMEKLMEKEKLFIWPSCFYPYEENVGLLNVNYPWPNYENGDLFLAWAELGTRCYAEKNPEIAVKYIRNVISRYEEDGLGFQRYTRVRQTGAGDDILSNNIMAIVGLYRNIYGIRPQYNRLYLEPHLTADLNGTKIKYRLRNQDYVIGLSQEKYSIGANSIAISGSKPFAVNISGEKLEYFNGDERAASLCISDAKSLSIDILNWDEHARQWKESGSNLKKTVRHELHNLKPDTGYQLTVNDKPIKQYTADSAGILRFDYPVDENILRIQVK